ncbi:MAG: recombinase family protein [Caloramator sp.]|nr:recombinase family protein [Caloramator sp.]
MQRKVIKIEPKIFKTLAKKRVAAYARVSSGKDSMLHSLSAQVSYYSEFIQRHIEWEYVGVYADEAFTGTKDERPEFQRLLKDCRDGKIDMVITKSISRFARNTVTMLEVVRELKSLNVDVYFEKENIHSLSGDGELMLTILASFAQEESRSVSENCKWRIRKGFKEGELVNLRFIYGYRIEKGKIEINEDEAKIVRMIFDDYINGMGCTKIARKLREMGAEKIRGGKWNSERVVEILKNEKYTGNALLQKKFVKDHLTKTLVRNKGYLPKYYAEETHPAIIDLVTFQKAQEILEERRLKYSPQEEGSNHLFSRRIICGICGKKYRRKINGKRVIWHCFSYLKYGKDACPSKQIPEDILNSVINEGEFDKSKIKEIQVIGERKLNFILNDGRVVEKEWSYKPRSESWSDEARQRAREKSLEIIKRRKNLWQEQ